MCVAHAGPAAARGAQANPRAAQIAIANHQFGGRLPSSRVRARAEAPGQP